ncbi:MAG TPA: FHA domain-containing serine/threonine-protein kinase [Anaerolineales bacterium]|nr:FHA domain-containing serine/threonine-protein kinase [Anaerolineales bacterium]
MSFINGATVGPYSIQELLGQGGMATVYKAYHSALDRYVAIKVLDATLGKERDFIERFKREARVIAKLDNGHIVPVYDFDEEDGQPYIVLKFIDGQTLRDRMKASPLSEFEILKIVSAVGDGLQYAHNRGVLHRDIKPSNVLVAGDGKIYLTDFGLARIVESASSLTGDMIVGTPQYMSPEQAINAEHLDEGTDIYSFGVMMYEMVTGCLPFDADTMFTVIEDHIHKPPPLPTSIKPDLPEEVERVILKALAKQRSDRYAKVADLVNAFKKAWLPNTEQRDTSSTTMESMGIASLLAETGKSFPVAEETVVLGRNSSARNIQNDIDLSDLDVKKIISRRHAMIQRENNEFVLHDLDSRNGTFVNGKRLSSNEPHMLVYGDVIEFGTGGVKLTFLK